VNLSFLTLYIKRSYFNLYSNM